MAIVLSALPASKASLQGEGEAGRGETSVSMLSPDARWNAHHTYLLVAVLSNALLAYAVSVPAHLPSPPFTADLDHHGPALDVRPSLAA
eukprot:184923-Chlamydomonas_euryale.AAC.1